MLCKDLEEVEEAKINKSRSRFISVSRNDFCLEQNIWSNSVPLKTRLNW